MVKDTLKLIIPAVIIGLLSIGIFVLLFLHIHFRIFDPDKGLIPGNIKAFDPIKAMPEVQEFAGKDAALLSILAYYVKPDGTLDIKAKYRPFAVYSFYRPINETEKVDEDIPLGAAKRNPISYHAELITVTIKKPQYYRITVNGDEITERETGMSRSHSKQTEDIYKNETIKAPDLSFKNIWNLALKEKAPAGAVAIIYYNKYGYNFSISDTKYKFQFDMNGNLIK